MNILTPQEAADTLGYFEPDEMSGKVSSILLPAIDEYLKTGTGRDWAADVVINPTAKLAAAILLSLWHDNPSMIGTTSYSNSENYTIRGLVTQLHAIALELVESET